MLRGKEYKLSDEVINLLTNYLLYGYKPGLFLTCVLKNKLVETFSFANDEEIEILPAVLYYIINELPSSCWGNPKIVDNWIVSKEYKFST